MGSKERFATRSPDRSLSKYLDRNVLRYPSRSAEMYPDRNVRMFLNNSAIIFQDKAAQHSTFVQFVNSRPTVKSLILVFIVYSQSNKFLLHKPPSNYITITM